jgi:RNA polymerase sigma factor (sigma-70 family)
MAKEQHPDDPHAGQGTNLVSVTLTESQLVFILRRARAIAIRYKIGDAEADDVAQDVVMRVMKAAPVIDDIEGAIRGPWLRRVARNRVFDRARRAATHRSAAPSLAADEDLLRARPSRPDIALANAEARQARLRLRSLLDVEARVLHVVERVNDNDLSRSEAAAKLEKPIGAYDKLAQDVKRKIRAAMIGDDPNDLFDVDAG